MSSDQTDNVTPALPKLNRRQRRLLAARNRSKRVPGQDTSVNYWVKRFIREMKDNVQVQEKVMSGALDKYLK